MRRNFYFLFLVLSGCRPTDREHSLEEFKAVDSSLKADLDSLEVPEQRSFDTTGKILSTVFDSTLFQIFMLKKKLAEADPTLEQLVIGDSVIIESSEGCNLYRRMKTCYELSKGTAFIKNPNSEFSLGEEIWQDRYFHIVPTIAVITIFSKFQDDVQHLK
jgi:hypothetical protein